MSFDALNWARQVRGITPAQKCILLLLADRAREQNECWPSVAGLAADACMTERGTKKCLRALVEAGVISIEPGNGRTRTSIYKLCVAEAETPNEAPERVNVVHLFGGDAAPEKGERRSERVNVVPKRVNVVPKRVNHVHPNHKEPIGTIRNQKRVSRASEAPSVEVPDWLPADAWQAWCDYRKGKRWTPEAARLSIRNLGKLRDEGNDPRAVIEQSIANGWTGLFPDKSRRAFAPQPARKSVLSEWHDLLNPQTPAFDFDATAEEITH